MTKAHRKFTPEQKVTILREHLVERRPVSDVRHGHHTHPALFYQRQRTFSEKGTAAFEGGRSPSRVAGHPERSSWLWKASLRSAARPLRS